MYQPRTYRSWVKNKDLVSFEVMVEETDCYISAMRNLQSKARKLILKYREILKKFIAEHPLFLTTLEPFPVGNDAPQIVKAMCQATAVVGVGPMASVAGAIAEFVGNELAPFSPELIIENGGDIYLKSLKSRLVGIYAGDASPFTGKIALEIKGQQKPLGISTSSGTVGHSLSFGCADACCVTSRSVALADAAATAVGNLVKSKQDIKIALKAGMEIEGVLGIVIIVGDQLGAIGDIELAKG